MAAPSTALEIPELNFAAGIPGFEEARRFTLVQWGESFFAVMRALDVETESGGGVEFVVVPPALFFPDYAPEIDDAVAERLGIESADDAVLLVVVTLGANPADATANLMAPIVVNRHTLEAAQVVLPPRSGEEYSIRTPLAPS
ncbi:MAG TPA: flagellar assembly protein FliW [Acidimicrobiia bacterium]|nr:flagellar assembly protein FliW [Acidimicrobiia bacterium]